MHRHHGEEHRRHSHHKHGDGHHKHGYDIINMVTLIRLTIVEVQDKIVYLKFRTLGLSRTFN